MANPRVRIFESHRINSRLLFDTIGRESTPGRARLSKASSRAWRSISYDKDLLSHGSSSFHYPLSPRQTLRFLPATTPLSSSSLSAPIYLFLLTLETRVRVHEERVEGTEKGEKLYRELLRGMMQWVRRRCRKKILNIALGRAWLSAKWLQ